MASIISYKCSNPECTLDVSLRINFPVWREDTPAVLRKVPVMAYNKENVLGYRSQRVCWTCHSIVDLMDGEENCPDCHTGDKLLVEGKPCLKCHNGTVVVDNGLLVSF